MAQHRASTREDRLKAALKANMSRRKAQKRARTDERPDGDAADAPPPRTTDAAKDD